jgi:uncharacterized protein YbcV (DUF1398 family)
MIVIFGIRTVCTVKNEEESLDGGTIMSNKLTEEELHKVIERRSTGKTSYGEFLEELSNIGVIQYDIYVATAVATYKGTDSEVKTDPQVDFVISQHFDKNEAARNIANIGLPFLDFLKGLADTGITSYNVNISEKKVTYHGINGEQLVEPVKP